MIKVDPGEARVEIKLQVKIISLKLPTSITVLITTVFNSLFFMQSKEQYKQKKELKITITVVDIWYN